jgi:hypothetical protein
MSPKPKRRKCRCCSTFFFPDYRNWKHQYYCGKPECRVASKLASQRRWYRKPKNLSHFRNGEGTERVRIWRKAHPGYWRKKTPVSGSTQTTKPQILNPEQTSRNVPRPLPRTLQDFCLAREPAFIGLLSMFTGSTLQDDIQSINSRCRTFSVCSSWNTTPTPSAWAPSAWVKPTWPPPWATPPVWKATRSSLPTPSMSSIN